MRRFGDRFLQDGAIIFGAGFPFSKVPTLIVWGCDDSVFHSSGAAALAEILPNSSIKLLENCGHIPHMEKAADVAEEITRFLGGLGADDNKHEKKACEVEF